MINLTKMKHSPTIYVIFLLSLVLNSANCSKILAIFPMPAPSHYILANALLRGLAEAGHDVAIIAPFEEKNPPKNGSWRDILLPATFVEESQKQMNQALSKEDANILEILKRSRKMSYEITKNTLNSTAVQNLLKSNEKFDVVIAGQFLNDGVKALATHLDAHLIVFSSIGTNSMVNHLVGNPSLPSFAPEMISSYPPKMNFLQRVFNTIQKFLFYINLYLFLYPDQNVLVKKYISESLDLEDILYNVSLVLINSHISISGPQPYVPCMKDIGGFHIKPPQQLPEDLKSFLDNAAEGVIYFSMGSILKSKNFALEKRTEVLNVFRKLKQKVLWKWEEDVLPDQPPNVKLIKWAPQQDVLAHPNVKAFITHGGLLSTTETIYHGIPIVAVPFFGDQKMNAYTAEVGGYGLVVPYQELTEERLSSALNEILTNPKYTEEVKSRSRIIKDQQIKPLDNAVYWVEYVIRHNGAKHLRVEYLNLAWYQYYLLDVFAFLFAVIYGFYVLFKRIILYIWKSRTERRKLKSN